MENASKSPDIFTQVSRNASSGKVICFEGKPLTFISLIYHHVEEQGFAGMGAGRRLLVGDMGIRVWLSLYDGSAFFELMISSTAISMTMVLSAPTSQKKADKIRHCTFSTTK